MAITLKFSAVFGGVRRALSNPVYRRYWTSNTITSTGRWMHRMAVGWLTWELTESTTWLGIVAFADAFPMVLFSVIAGAIADRAGYLSVMRISQFAVSVLAVIFAVLTISGTITIELVLALSLLIGSVDALNMPARMSLVHSLVPRADLSTAIALGSATFNASRFVGPAIAGGLLLWVDIGTVIAIAAAGFVQLFFVLLSIRIDPVTRDGDSGGNLLDDIGKGIGYVMGHPGILFLMVLLGVTGLLIRPCIELLPGFAAQVFDRGADGLAMLMSSIGLGATCSGFWLAQRGRTVGLTKLVTTGLLVSGLSLALFTVSGFIWLAAFFLASVGFFMLVGGIGSQTLIQNAVASSMRARVMSLFVVISWGLPALGALAAGAMAARFGLQMTIGVGAALTVLVWVWAHRRGQALSNSLETIE